MAQVISNPSALAEGASTRTPALWTKAWTPLGPASRSTSTAAARTDATLEQSPTTTATLGPAAAGSGPVPKAASADAARISAAAASPLSRPRHTRINGLAPRRASARAAERPRPRAAPVMTTHFSDMSGSVADRRRAAVFSSKPARVYHFNPCSVHCATRRAAAMAVGGEQRAREGGRARGCGVETKASDCGGVSSLDGGRGRSTTHP